MSANGGKRHASPPLVTRCPHLNHFEQEKHPRAIHSIPNFRNGRCSHRDVASGRNLSIVHFPPRLLMPATASRQQVPPPLILILPDPFLQLLLCSATSRLLSLSPSFSFSLSFSLPLSSLPPAHRGTSRKHYHQNLPHKMRAIVYLLCALLVAAATAQGTGTGSSTGTAEGTSGTGGMTTAGAAASAAAVDSTEPAVFCPEPSSFFTGDGLTFPGCNITAGAA